MCMLFYDLTKLVLMFSYLLPKMYYSLLYLTARKIPMGCFMVPVKAVRLEVPVFLWDSLL